MLKNEKDFVKHFRQNLNAHFTQYFHPEKSSVSRTLCRKYLKEYAKVKKKRRGLFLLKFIFYITWLKYFAPTNDVLFKPKR